MLSAFSSKCLLPFLVTVTCLLLILIISTPETTGCSWGYPIWIIRSKSADPLYRFMNNGKAGYIDSVGNIVIAPQFEGGYGNKGGEFHNGLMLPNGFGKYVDTWGKSPFDQHYSYAFDFSEGLAMVDDKANKWGYINTSGEFVITPRFDGASSFSEGLAAIRVGTEFGYIDRSGELVIPPRFVYGGDFHDGMAFVVAEGPCRYSWPGPCGGSDIFPRGTIRFDRIPQCSYGFIDRSGALISEKRYDSTGDFAEGLAPVRIGKKWGYIDKTGQVVIETKFDDANPFADGLALVGQDEMFGYIDRSGAFAISPEFRYAEDFSEGLAVVGTWFSDTKYRRPECYYINKQGKQAIAEKFRYASHFFKGLAHVRLKPVSSDGKSDWREERSFAYIDATGRKVFTYSETRTN